MTRLPTFRVIEVRPPRGADSDGAPVRLPLYIGPDWGVAHSVFYAVLRDDPRVFAPDGGRRLVLTQDGIWVARQKTEADR